MGESDCPQAGRALWVSGNSFPQAQSTGSTSTGSIISQPAGEKGLRVKVDGPQ